MRERATIRDKPSLASHADIVRRSRFRVVFWKTREFIFQAAIPRKREIRRSSKQSSIDRKCSRFIRIPIKPR